MAEEEKKPQEEEKEASKEKESSEEKGESEEKEPSLNEEQIVQEHVELKKQIDDVLKEEESEEDLDEDEAEGTEGESAVVLQDVHHATSAQGGEGVPGERRDRGMEEPGGSVPETSGACRASG